jgi:peptidoglycan/xylan/chitin deacetylase (PgdA/CDA1 family)
MLRAFEEGRPAPMVPLYRSRARITCAWLSVLVGCLSGACALEPPGDATLGLFGNADPRVFYGREIGERLIALTIDDAPDLESTPRILAALRAHDAHATFFVIGGQVPGSEALIRQIVEDGHEIGNHMARDEKSVDLDPDEFERRLLLTQAELSRFAPVRWFRPGSGYYSEAMLDVLDRHGLRCALGTVYPLDAQIRWGWLVRSWIDWRAEPGAVVILHDRGRRGLRTASTLDRVLPRLREEGYRTVTLSALADWAGPTASHRVLRAPLASLDRPGGG